MNFQCVRPDPTTGFPCDRSMKFISDYVEQHSHFADYHSLCKLVARFEVSIPFMDFEEAILALPVELPEEFYAYLRDVVPHVCALHKAESALAMHQIATDHRHPNFFDAQKWFFDASAK